MRCTVCHQVLDDRAPVWLRHFKRRNPQYQASCEPCMEHVYGQKHGIDWREDYREGLPCAFCARPVHLSKSHCKLAPQRVHCGEACRRKWWSRWQSERRKVQPHQTTCDGCGTTFLAHRSDARFCSPACKQRAYRSAPNQQLARKNR